MKDEKRLNPEITVILIGGALLFVIAVVALVLVFTDPGTKQSKQQSEEETIFLGGVDSTSQPVQIVETTESSAGGQADDILSGDEYEEAGTSMPESESEESDGSNAETSVSGTPESSGEETSSQQEITVSESEGSSEETRESETDNPELQDTQATLAPGQSKPELTDLVVDNAAILSENEASEIFDYIKDGFKEDKTASFMFVTNFGTQGSSIYDYLSGIYNEKYAAGKIEKDTVALFIEQEKLQIWVLPFGQFEDQIQPSDREWLQDLFIEKYVASNDYVKSVASLYDCLRIYYKETKE